MPVTDVDAEVGGSKPTPPLSRSEPVAAVEFVVAGVAEESVGAGGAEELVVAGAAGDAVVAVAAGDDVVAASAGDAVVAGAAVDGGGDVELAERDAVVAAERVDEDFVDVVEVDGRALGVDADGERRAARRRAR